MRARGVSTDTFFLLWTETPRALLRVMAIPPPLLPTIPCPLCRMSPPIKSPLLPRPFPPSSSTSSPPGRPCASSPFRHCRRKNLGIPVSLELPLLPLCCGKISLLLAHLQDITSHRFVHQNDGGNFDWISPNTERNSGEPSPRHQITSPPHTSPPASPRPPDHLVRTPLPRSISARRNSPCSARHHLGLILQPLLLVVTEIQQDRRSRFRARRNLLKVVKHSIVTRNHRKYLDVDLQYAGPRRRPFPQ
jgi:hypothetical protein